MNLIKKYRLTFFIALMSITLTYMVGLEKHWLGIITIVFAVSTCWVIETMFPYNERTSEKRRKTQ